MYLHVYIYIYTGLSGEAYLLIFCFWKPVGIAGATLRGIWASEYDAREEIQLLERPCSRSETTEPKPALPEVAGLTEDAWMNDQAAVLQALVVKAKMNGPVSTLKASDKSQSAKAAPPPPAMDDWVCYALNPEA